MSAAKIVLTREIERCEGILKDARKNGDGDKVSLFLVIKEYESILNEILELEAEKHE